MSRECQEIEPWLWNFAERSLSGGEAERVEAHLVSCTACRDQVRLYRETVCRLTVFREQAVPLSEVTWAALQAQLEARSSETSARTKKRLAALGLAGFGPRLRALTFAGTAATLLLVALLSRSPHRPAPEAMALWNAPVVSLAGTDPAAQEAGNAILQTQNGSAALPPPAKTLRKLCPEPLHRNSQPADQTASLVAVSAAPVSHRHSHIKRSIPPVSVPDVPRALLAKVSAPNRSETVLRPAQEEPTEEERTLLTASSTPAPSAPAPLAVDGEKIAANTLTQPFMMTLTPVADTADTSDGVSGNRLPETMGRYPMDHIPAVTATRTASLSPSRSSFRSAEGGSREMEAW